MWVRGSIQVIAYALLTAVVTLFLASLLGGSSKSLAMRVDRNADVTARSTGAVICILRLGVSPDAPPRTDENINACLEEWGLHVPLAPPTDEP